MVPGCVLGPVTRRKPLGKQSWFCSKHFRVYETSAKWVRCSPPLHPLKARWTGPTKGNFESLTADDRYGIITCIHPTLRVLRVLRRHSVWTGREFGPVFGSALTP